MENLDDLMLLAESDPQIADKEKFTSYLQVQLRAERMAARNQPQATTYKEASEPSVIDFTFSAEPGGLVYNTANNDPIPVTSKDKLKEYPNQSMNQFRVYNDDSITLKTYRKMGNDADLALGTLILIGMVSGLKFKISSPNPAVQAVINDLYEPHHNHLIRNMIRSGARDGFAFAEKVWTQQNLRSTNIIGSDVEQVFSGIVYALKKIKFIDPCLEIRYYKRRTTDELTHVEQFQKGSLVRVKRDKLLWFAMDREYSSLFGNSRYKKAYSSWYYGKLVDQYELNHLQKVGSPLLEGRYPSGTTPVNGTSTPNDVIIKTMARYATANGSVSMPSDRDEDGNYYWTLEYKEPKNNSVAPYSEFKERNKNRKYRALGILAQLVADANFSDTDAKLQLQMIIMEDLIDQLQDVIKQDIIDYLVLYNFGEDEVSQVKFTIDRSSLGRASYVKDIVMKALTMGASFPGYTPNVMPDVRGSLADLGMDSVAFDEYFTLNPEMQQEESGEGRSPLGRDNNNQESNRNRDTSDERDRGRATAQGR